MADLPLSERILGALWGSVVGDALGVPAEFMDRADLDRQPICKMVGGGHHGQPAGTWSDDTTLTLIACRWTPYGLPSCRFLQDALSWLEAGSWSAHGQCFDVGTTTRQAILSRFLCPDQATWGITGDQASGNGSLMRNLPVALWHRGEHPTNLIAAARRSSAISHAEPLCQDACAIHALIVAGLCRGQTARQATREAVLALQSTGSQIHPALSLVGDFSVFSASRDQIRSDGFVASTIEAALWCLDRYSTFQDAVLAAVNLGHDSDTTAAVVGGLAGLIHGNQAIPVQWIEELANRQLLTETFDRFIKEYRSHAP